MDELDIPLLQLTNMKWLGKEYNLAKYVTTNSSLNKTFMTPMTTQHNKHRFMLPVLQYEPPNL